MRRRSNIGLPTLLSAIVALSAATTDVHAQGSIDVQVTRKDGVEFAGRLEIDAFRLTTEFGSAKVTADRIRSLTFGAPSTIQTTGQHTLRGKLQTETLLFVVNNIKTEMRTADLAKLVRRLPNATAATFTGEWMTNFGPLVIAQTGTAVTGSWSHNKLPLTGTVTDGKLSIRYRAGRAEFRRDGELLRGEYIAPNSQRGPWLGYTAQPRPAERKPGQITAGQTKAWLNYHLHLPKNFDPKQRYPGLVLLHDKDSSARSAVAALAEQPGIGDAFILIGLEGDRMSHRSRGDTRAYNYSYARFGGSRVGDASRFRESPALISEALYQIKAELPVRTWFLAGEGVGGTVALAVGMFFPSALAGVFAARADQPRQYAPRSFTDPTTRKLQQKLAIALADGPTGASALWRHSLVEAGFPAVRWSAGKTANQALAAAAVWLEQITTTNPAQLLAFAEWEAKQAHYRSAAAALLRCAEGERKAALWSRLDQAAKTAAEKLLPRIQANADNTWIDDFLAFRSQFALLPAAAPVRKAYQQLRQQHERPAGRLFGAAFRMRDPKQKAAKYREIVTRYYASSFYPLAAAALK